MHIVEKHQKQRKIDKSAVIYSLKNNKDAKTANANKSEYCSKKHKTFCFMMLFHNIINIYCMYVSL